MHHSRLPQGSMLGRDLGAGRLRASIAWTTTALLSLLGTGCMGADGAFGPDGADGGTAVSITWVYAPQSFSLSDTRIPLLVTRDVYYWTLPGSYRVSYIAWDGSFWTGTYTVTYDPGAPGQPGEKGKLFWQSGRDGAPGADGLDFYYRVGLYSTGPTISFVGAALVDETGLAERAAYAKARQDIAAVSETSPIDTSPVRTTVRKGPWTIRSEFRRGDPAAMNQSPAARRNGAH